MGFSTRRIKKDELQNVTILNGDIFSKIFLIFYNTLDPTTATNNSQKRIVQNYLIKHNYNKGLIDSLKGCISKSSPKTLRVEFSDGTQINDKYASPYLGKNNKKIGIAKVNALNLLIDNRPFISQDKSSLSSAQG